MNAIKLTEETHDSIAQVEAAHGKPSTLNVYPLLGFLLILLTAILAYGAIFFFLFHDTLAPALADIFPALRAE